MSDLTWNLEGIKNNSELCWEYTEDPLSIDIEGEWKEINNGMYVRMAPKTHALIQSTKEVHLASLIQGNINEWKYRLDQLFDAGVSFLFCDGDEGEVPLRTRFSDLSTHLGLKTNTSVWEKERFDSYIRELRMKRQLGSLDLET